MYHKCLHQSIIAETYMYVPYGQNHWQIWGGARVGHNHLSPSKTECPLAGVVIVNWFQ